MKLFKKEEAKKEPAVRIDRLKNLDRSSLLTWFDNSIMGLGATFDGWRYHGHGPTAVEEHLTALSAIWAELQSRVDDQAGH